MIHAVIDTNVFVSAFITPRQDSPTRRILNAILDAKVTPLVNFDILAEYLEVLSRSKFSIEPKTVNHLMFIMRERGITVAPEHFAEKMPDEKDRVFYEVTLAAQDKDARLVTGNTKHFPKAPFVVTPTEFMAIVDAAYPEDAPAA